ncbi:hypothetical protein QQB53_18780 [Niallia sp. SS-2023]|uniref:hypothetical protein n=1 Tax=Niallia sp. SS-2023 TaxID=3051155 RepID=UPI00254E2F61|nr:hypothetical protein [Niallia sp. SS-2023]MDL0437818.1 hypothetical protein [Niallia sp. SS-2023]
MKENQLLLGEGDFFIAKEMGFLPSELPWERGLYKKWVLSRDVQGVWEERTLLE